MQKTRQFGLLLAALTAMITAVGAIPAQATRGVSVSTSDVAWFADPGTAVGTSHLIRTDDGVLGSFRTSGLMPYEALTLWWVVFNNPEGCTDPCGEDDIFRNGDPAQGVSEEGVDAADIVVGYAGGTVANRHGNVFMVSRLGEDGAVQEVLFGTRPLLKDSHRAEVHLVARSHGPAVRGTIREQIGSYAGGCEVFMHPPAIPADIGECADIQFAIHQP